MFKKNVVVFDVENLSKNVKVSVIIYDLVFEAHHFHSHAHCELNRIKNNVINRAKTKKKKTTQNR